MSGHPTLWVRVELENDPRYRLQADTAEDQERLLAWLARPGTRRRLVASLDLALERLSERTAA